MRDDILSRWRCEADGSSTDGHSSGAGGGTPLCTPDEPATPPRSRTGPYRRQGTLYAVEVCWISDGAVTCRTYRVCAANESRAARIGCRWARRVLRRRRVTRIEAVDVEPIGWRDGHE